MSVSNTTYVSYAYDCGLWTMNQLPTVNQLIDVAISVSIVATGIIFGISSLSPIIGRNASAIVGGFVFITAFHGTIRSYEAIYKRMCKQIIGIVQEAHTAHAHDHIERMSVFADLTREVFLQIQEALRAAAATANAQSDRDS